MTHTTWNKARALRRLLAIALAAAGALASNAATAAVPGISGPAFNLSASADLISMPDGAMIYSWGYGCTTGTVPAGFLPAGVPGATCPLMQLPGPTMIVHEGDTVSVTLTNKLPAAAGNTSLVFEGIKTCSATFTPAVAASGVTPATPATCTGTASGVPGLLTQEAAPNGTVTYTFTADKPGTYSYHSGTQADLQVEMGLYGALIVLPTGTALCPARSAGAGVSYSLAPSAYDHPGSCYDREYLFQFAELSGPIHQQAQAQAAGAGPIVVATEPYHPNYFLLNGRSMPDDMDAPYSPAYVHQPYNGNPHMHPGEMVLMRVIGQGRWQHPFHFHGNHARVLARDGGMLLAASDAALPLAQQRLAGPLQFTIGTVSGQTVDAMFSWTGQNLNWDVYGLATPHTCNGVTVAQATANLAAGVVHPSAVDALLKANGGFDPTTHEYCADHAKPIPVVPPDPQIVANGLWYGGTPYLGLQAANPTPLPPGQVRQNTDAGYAYMWHSHAERELTTNDVFPGGYLMMLIIEPPSAAIDETL